VGLSAKEQVQEVVIGERLTVHSKILGEDRTILIALPGDYDETEGHYPVLYVLDGEFFFNQAFAAVQFLSECTYMRTHQAPRMITVGIVNVDRNRDFTPTHAPVQGDLRYPTSGGGALFLAFLQAELRPLIDSKFRTEPYSILSGWSFGGLFTIQTYLDSPDAFSAYLAISPSLWWEQDLLVERTRSAVAAGCVGGPPLVVTLGALEGGDMDRSVRRGWIPLFEDEDSAVPSFRSVEIGGHGHGDSPYEAFFEGLSALFEDWALPQERANDGLESVQDFYEALSTRKGYAVDVPESAYQALVASLLSAGDTKAALEMARLIVDRYPRSSRAHRTLGVALLRRGDIVTARERFKHALKVEMQRREPDSERIMDIRLMLWLLNQRSDDSGSDDGEEQPDSR
jgi:predicted alpha/beta superfamily hydrolase